jgi:hypothetical protein
MGRYATTSFLSLFLWPNAHTTNSENSATVQRHVVKLHLNLIQCFSDSCIGLTCGQQIVLFVFSMLNSLSMFHITYVVVLTYLLFLLRLAFHLLKTVGSRGRAMAQVVSRRPLTAEARVRAPVNPCGICGEQSGTGAGFSPSSSVFPCQYIIPPSLSKLVSSGGCVTC